MGEYVSFNGKEIKVGVCERFYGMRHSDINKVKGFSAQNAIGVRFRLPWPSEDHLSPGEYGDFRGMQLYQSQARTAYGPKGAYAVTDHVDYSPEWLSQAGPGSIQLRHDDSGLLISVPCHHGFKLPDLGSEASVHWNGKRHSLELVALKVLEDGLLAPIVWCRHCGKMWRVDWDEVMPFIPDPVMKMRLEVYANAKVSND
jgi:hypothetical protein